MYLTDSPVARGRVVHNIPKWRQNAGSLGVVSRFPNSVFGTAQRDKLE